jgi:hypothetical protein
MAYVTVSPPALLGARKIRAKDRFDAARRSIEVVSERGATPVLGSPLIAEIHGLDGHALAAPLRMEGRKTVSDYHTVGPGAYPA